jgi:hypothetical protein
LIAGLSAWGVSTLSRVKLPDEVKAPLPVVAIVTEEERPREVLAAAPKAEPAALLPATIPEFPFPDDLVAAAEVPAAPVESPSEVVSLAEIPVDAIPELAAFEGEVEAVAEAAAVTSTVPEEVAATTGEPPIPVPARPLAERPVEAVPLAEVKTLYVVADMLNVRAVPSTSGPVLQRVAQGFAVAPRQQANEWIGFLMQDGTTGWMRTDYLSDTMPPANEALAAPDRIESPGTEPTGSEPLNLMM